MNFFVSVLLASCAVTFAFGEDWIGGDGAYEVDANWSGRSTPGPDDEAVIDNGGIVTIGEAVDASRLCLGTSDGSSGTLIQSNGGLTAQGAFIGEEGSGSLTISGGFRSGVFGGRLRKGTSSSCRS